MKSSVTAAVDEVAIGLAMTTSTVPAEPAGATAVIFTALSTVNSVAATSPNFTDVAPRRPVPLMTTVVPPAAAPLAGTRLDTDGTS